MLARASSDAGTRLRRSKSTSTTHKHQPPILEPLDPEIAQKQAVAAATAAFVRAQANEEASRKYNRSIDMSRSKSSASRKSLTSQGSHFPPRESSFRSLQPQRTGQPASSLARSREPTITTEQFPPFYVTPSSDGPLSVSRPVSAVSYVENGRFRPQSGSQRQSATSSMTSLQIRKARSMYYASSVQTGSPIARPPAKYLTTQPPVSGNTTPDIPPLLPLTKPLIPSPLAASRVPVTVAVDGTIHTARDKYLQGFQQKSVKHKPSIFLAPFRKRPLKDKEKRRQTASETIGIYTGSQQIPNESTIDVSRVEFLTGPDVPSQRSFSGSLRNKFKKVFKRASNRSLNLPVQQIEASRDYFNIALSRAQEPGNVYAIPSPDEQTLQRVRSRTPSIEGSLPGLPRSGSRSSSNGSARSNRSGRSLHSETNATHISTSRMTSWGTSSTGDGLTQRATKRLTVIHEAKDSIGSEADCMVAMIPRRKSLSHSALAAFRDPMPMECLTEESLTPVDPKRVFSALMREIGASKSTKPPPDPASRTPGAESDVFESSETKGLHTHTRELQSKPSRDFRSSISSDQRPPSRRPGSAAAQSVQSKSSALRSLGRVFRSTIRTVTPTEQQPPVVPERTSSMRGAVHNAADMSVNMKSGSVEIDCQHAHGGTGGIDNRNIECCPASRQDSTPWFTPSASQIEKRVERAKDRWKSTLDESEKPQFPRETDRTYNVANFAQHTGIRDPNREADEGDQTSLNISQIFAQVDTCDAVGGPESPAPRPQPLMSPLSPSVYSRNTDGASILPNDSVTSFDRPGERESQCGGSAVILTSQSVRSYMVGTPSPRRPDSTRTSRDWRAWLSHEISNMESISQEDLRIHERYMTSPTRYRRSSIRASHAGYDDATVSSREANDTPTLVSTNEVPRCAEILESEIDQQAETRPIEQCIPTPSTVLEKSESHPDTYKEVSYDHTPTSAKIVDHPVQIRSTLPCSTPVLSSQHQSSNYTPSGTPSQVMLETPRSSRMNDRFPFINTGRRSSSNSVHSSRKSKSPTDSVASLKSLSSRVTPSSKIYSDLSAPATHQTAQWVPSTALKCSDAQLRKKENSTPPATRETARPNVSSSGSSSRLRTMPSSSLATVNQNTSPNGRGIYNSSELKPAKHSSIPIASPARPRVHITLRTMSPEKLARRPKSSFDLRDTKTRNQDQTGGAAKPNVDVGRSTPPLRWSPGLRHPVIILKSSASSQALKRDAGAVADVRCGNGEDRSGIVTPGQRMVDRFLNERKSTTALDGVRMRGGLRLTREDTPAFL